MKEKISITIDKEIIDKIRDISKKDDRKPSQMINKILKDYLNK
ncbi:ribbon-helix-helix domain-containing protein [Staphylococcus kloosii]|nr:toxin-antitoxin system protein [Staphylococcus kloosii]MBF7029659.1 toxin-antitoxin system protein [Staphylococcus kloosii]